MVSRDHTHRRNPRSLNQLSFKKNSINCTWYMPGTRCTGTYDPGSRTYVRHSRFNLILPLLRLRTPAARRRSVTPNASSYARTYHPFGRYDVSRGLRSQRGSCYCYYGCCGSGIDSHLSSSSSQNQAGESVVRGRTKVLELEPCLLIERSENP